MNKLLRIIPYILLVLNLFFIFGNSVLDGPRSMAISARAEQTIEQMVGTDFSDDPKEPFAFKRTFNSFLRKSAHAIEFCSLGILAFICMHPLPFLTRVLSLTLFGVLVPLIDETIQLFRMRTAMIRDVWIDISGFAAGCLVSIVVWNVYKLVKKRLAK